MGHIRRAVPGLGLVDRRRAAGSRRPPRRRRRPGRGWGNHVRAARLTVGFEAGSERTTTGDQGARLLERGLRLEYLTLGWNVVGAVVVAAAAAAARSVAMAGFGLDSLIEIFASLVVVWHLKGIARNR